MASLRAVLNGIAAAEMAIVIIITKVIIFFIIVSFLMVELFFAFFYCKDMAKNTAMKGIFPKPRGPFPYIV